MNTSQARSAVYTAHSEVDKAVAELIDEIKRLTTENEKLRVLVEGAAHKNDIVSASVDWYNDSDTTSSWNRPCDADYTLRLAVGKALGK